MNQMKLFLALALASFILTACGGSDNTGSSEPSEPVGNTETDDTQTGTQTDGAQPGSDTQAPQPIVTLSPLPNPALSEPPSANDEPAPLSQAFHTITDFQVVGEPSPRVPLVKVQELTEADFAAGLPEPVITVPDNVDPSTNTPPFFEDIDNIRVEAGDLVQLRFAPRDAEGGLPGMFEEALPAGASFDDNFDGSKSLVWQTFQADIGVNSFMVTAIDPANGLYRSKQTVLIAVDEPSNPDNIPNVVPEIQPIDNFTVRAGDPVAIFIEGFDRNGTNPALELVNPPADATLTLDPRDEEFHWLRLVAETPGELVVNILARDSVDTTLTEVYPISLNVLAASEFERPGPRLRDAASNSSITFGSALSPVFYLQADGAIYEEFASTEFAIMTPESSMKWSLINPLPGLYEFSDTDNLMTFAQLHDMSVRGHPLVWHRTLPVWVEESNVEDREVLLREFITRLVNRYGDDVAIWDVINEPMNDSDGQLRESLWFEAMGESYIDIAFLQARELDPTATLVLNEFDIGFAGPKFDGFLALIDRMQDRDVPFDAVGFQMHVFSEYDQFDDLADHMEAVAQRGLDIHITELDVALSGGGTEAIQADVYRQVIEVCKAQPRCTVLQTWGFTDRYSFRTDFNPLYLDRNHQVKEAYSAIQEALSAE